MVPKCRRKEEEEEKRKGWKEKEEGDRCKRGEAYHWAYLHNVMYVDAIVSTSSVDQSTQTKPITNEKLPSSQHLHPVNWADEVKTNIFAAVVTSSIWLLSASVSQ
jgi:hypothetical protein